MSSTTKNTITYSSELMKNYLHATIMDAEDAFEALQDANGNGILFSIGTDGVFYAIQEVPAHNNTNGSAGNSAGWVKHDLSTTTLNKDFPGGAAKCKTQVVNQDHSKGTIGLAMVVTEGGSDTLYLSMGNSASVTTWLASPVWTKSPFNAPSGPAAPTPFTILNVFINETSDGQFVVVDINVNNLVQRYYITFGASGPVWNEHAMAIDLTAGEPYSSCLGRIAKSDGVDGMFTFGSVNGNPQFMYCPLWNAYGGGPATPVLLNLPGTGSSFNQPQAMAAFPNGDSDGSTDLFVTATDSEGSGVLYYFSAKMVGSPVSGVQIFKNPAFINVSKLHADLTNGVVTVWGLNSAHELFYTSSPYDQVTNSGSWSIPAPVLIGVDMVSPYVNKTNDGNTIFASDGDANLYLLTKSPETSMWRTSHVALPAPDPKTPAVSFSSYTTRLCLTDAHNQPVGKVPLMISASSRAGFYVNNLFTVLDTTPVQINTDDLGVITIIESVNSLHGTKLTVSESGGTTIVINPMDKPFKKAASLNTSEALKSAVITNGVNSSTRPLVPSGTSQDTLKAAAQANQQLARAYTHLSTGSAGTAAMAITRDASSVEGVLEGIAMDFGDLYNWLKSGVEAIVELVEDAATGLYHFIAKIAGQVYHAVLDCVEKVVGAIVWIYNKIKTALDDLIQFLEFLFEIKDIERTKKVLQNIATLFLQEQVDQIEVIKNDFDHMIGDAEKAINNWAGRGDVTGLGTDGTTPINKTSKPASGNSAPGALLSHHLQNNAQNASFLSSPQSPPKPGNPVSVLINALEQEWEVLGESVDAISQLVGDIGSMSVEELVKQIIAIIADTTLESVKVVVDALLDLIYDMAELALAAFETKIHIPVISDILSDFGIPEFSFLDVICWAGAIPVTLAYKIAEGRAPFADDDETKCLTGATSFTALAKQFPGSPSASFSSVLAAPKPMLAREETNFAVADSNNASTLVALSESTAETVFVICHGMAGVSGLFSAFFDAVEAAEETGENMWIYPSAVSAIVGGGLQVGANFLVPKNPIQNTAVNWVYRATSGIRFVCKAIFSGPGQKFVGGKASLNKLQVEDARGVGAVVDAVLVLPALACSCWHFYELAEAKSSSSRTAGILDESSNVAAYFARVSYAVAVNTEAEVKAAAIVALVVADLTYGGLQVAEVAEAD